MKHKFTFGEVTTTDEMPELTPERIAYIERRAGEEIPALLARIVQDGLALGTFPVVRGLTFDDLAKKQEERLAGDFVVPDRPHGDFGQRYEVTYLEDGGERKVYGWSDDLKATEHMCRMINMHPERRDPKVRDRHLAEDDPYEPVARLLSR